MKFKIQSDFAQNGSRRNTLAGASDAKLYARIISYLPSAGIGLEVHADDCLIEGLGLTGFETANIHLQGNNNVVRGCWLGFDNQGSPQTPNSGYALSVNNVAPTA